MVMLIKFRTHKNAYKLMSVSTCIVTFLLRL